MHIVTSEKNIRSKGPSKKGLLLSIEIQSLNEKDKAKILSTIDKMNTESYATVKSLFDIK